MNKTIWMLWLQGWDRAPTISDKCVESWKYHNPDWDIILLDENNYSNYIDLDKTLPGLNTNNISLSNIIRVSLIKEYGGVWADSTLFCNKSLDKWLPEDSFLFSNPSPTRMICSWFIFGERSSKIITDWYNSTVEYWKWRIENTDQYEQVYGWSHELFKKCYLKSDSFRKIWDSKDHIQASTSGNRGLGPHYFVPYEKYFFAPKNDEDVKRINSKVDPVYKLSYKVKTDWRNTNNRGIHPGNEKIKTPYISGGILDYLLETI